VGFKKYLDTELFCPLSGLKIKGYSIPIHKMGVMVCENGALFAKCSLHLVRCFISDWPTVKSIVDNAKVIKIVEVKPKEKKNVAS
jgi:hypothetical protein